MSGISAAKQIGPVVSRLKSWIGSSGISLRQICLQTEGLSPPEVMQGPNLGTVLKSRPNKNLYLQQMMVLCNAIDMPAAALFLGVDDPRVAKDAIKMAIAFCKLPEARRAHLLSTVLAEAAH